MKDKQIHCVYLLRTRFEGVHVSSFRGFRQIGHVALTLRYEEMQAWNEIYRGLVDSDKASRLGADVNTTKFECHPQ